MREIGCENCFMFHEGNWQCHYPKENPHAEFHLKDVVNMVQNIFLAKSCQFFLKKLLLFHEGKQEGHYTGEKNICDLFLL